MEWAACREVPASFFEGYPSVDHFDDVDSGEKFIDKILRYFAAHQSIPVRLPNSVALGLFLLRCFPEGLKSG